MTHNKFRETTSEVLENTSNIDNSIYDFDEIHTFDDVINFSKNQEKLKIAVNNIIELNKRFDNYIHEKIEEILYKKLLKIEEVFDYYKDDKTTNIDLFESSLDFISQKAENFNPKYDSNIQQNYYLIWENKLYIVPTDDEIILDYKIDDYKIHLKFEFSTEIKLNNIIRFVKENFEFVFDSNQNKIICFNYKKFERCRQAWSSN